MKLLEKKLFRGWLHFNYCSTGFATLNHIIGSNAKEAIAVHVVEIMERSFFSFQCQCIDVTEINSIASVNYKNW